jgi:hypothetical protein
MSDVTPMLPNIESGNPPAAEHWTTTQAARFPATSATDADSVWPYGQLELQHEMGGGGPSDAIDYFR